VILLSVQSRPGNGLNKPVPENEICFVIKYSSFSAAVKPVFFAPARAGCTILNLFIEESLSKEGFRMKRFRLEESSYDFGHR